MQNDMRVICMMGFGLFVICEHRYIHIYIRRQIRVITYIIWDPYASDLPSLSTWVPRNHVRLGTAPSLKQRDPALAAPEPVQFCLRIRSTHVAASDPRKKEKTENTMDGASHLSDLFPASDWQKRQERRERENSTPQSQRLPKRGPSANNAPISTASKTGPLRQ